MKYYESYISELRRYYDNPSNYPRGPPRAYITMGNFLNQVMPRIPRPQDLFRYVMDHFIDNMYVYNPGVFNATVSVEDEITGDNVGMHFDLKEEGITFGGNSITKRFPPDEAFTQMIDKKQANSGEEREGPRELTFLKLVGAGNAFAWNLSRPPPVEVIDEEEEEEEGMVTPHPRDPPGVGTPRFLSLPENMKEGRGPMLLPARRSAPWRNPGGVVLVDLVTPSAAFPPAISPPPRILSSLEGEQRAWELAAGAAQAWAVEGYSSDYDSSDDSGFDREVEFILTRGPAAPIAVPARFPTTVHGEVIIISGSRGAVVASVLGQADAGGGHAVGATEEGAAQGKVCFTCGGLNI